MSLNDVLHFTGLHLDTLQTKRLLHRIMCNLYDTHNIRLNVDDVCHAYYTLSATDEIIISFILKQAQNICRNNVITKNDVFDVFNTTVNTDINMYNNRIDYLENMVRQKDLLNYIKNQTRSIVEKEALNLITYVVFRNKMSQLKFACEQTIKAKKRHVTLKTILVSLNKHYDGFLLAKITNTINGTIPKDIIYHMSPPVKKHYKFGELTRDIIREQIKLISKREKYN